ncbi:hypothetical protein BJ742DRAFT_503606 [Cladochytrium replicatum]|nr:hypothetical protein BJ742DRAFT_503606 [Cladochytrium replicatum]
MHQAEALSASRLLKCKEWDGRLLQHQIDILHGQLVNVPNHIFQKCNPRARYSLARRLRSYLFFPPRNLQPLPRYKPKQLMWRLDSNSIPFFTNEHVVHAARPALIRAFTTSTSPIRSSNWFSFATLRQPRYHWRDPFACLYLRSFPGFFIQKFMNCLERENLPTFKVLIDQLQCRRLSAEVARCDCDRSDS